VIETGFDNRPEEGFDLDPRNPRSGVRTWPKRMRPADVGGPHTCVRGAGGF